MGKSFPSEKGLLVLRLLRDAPAGLYGLELVKASGGRLKRGTVYLTLGRLEEKGFIESRTKPQDNHPGLPRPIYRLNAMGQRLLSAAEMMGLDLAGIV